MIVRVVFCRIQERNFPTRRAATGKTGGRKVFHSFHREKAPIPPTFSKILLDIVFLFFFLFLSDSEIVLLTVALTVSDIVYLIGIRCYANYAFAF